MRYSYILQKKSDYKKIAVATLKRVFSPTVVPRVLLNGHLDYFIKHTCGTIFLCQLNDVPKAKFKQYVHKKNYDLDLYFYNCGKYTFVDIIDGNGNFASKHTLSIFDDIMLKSKRDVIDEFNLIIKTYKKLNIDDLLSDVTA